MIGLLLALSLAATSPSSCKFEGEPRTWTEGALEAWDRLDRDRIQVAKPTTPTLILFDEACVYRFTPDMDGDFRAGGRAYAVRSEGHPGTVELPGGRQVPARKLSFAAPADGGDMFFVMSLPAIWRADEAEGRDPDLLAMVVFMHEFAHTQQGAGLGRRIDDLISRGLPENTDDDSLQNSWSGNEGYVAAYESERDLFYEAASAQRPTDQRRLLTQAAAAVASRRHAYLGDELLWQKADDVFLTFEGTGNWAAWTWLTDPRGGAMSRQAATEFVRGGRRWWSQDEGLGIMLALDALLPEWPTHAFGDPGMTAADLIALALGADPDR